MEAFPQPVCPITEPHVRHRIPGTWRDECPGVDVCVRCGETIRTVPVVAFVRDGLGFRPTDVRLCLSCGANGANTLSADERERLGL